MELDTKMVDGVDRIHCVLVTLTEDIVITLSHFPFTIYVYVPFILRHILLHEFRACVYFVYKWQMYVFARDNADSNSGSGADGSKCNNT